MRISFGENGTFITPLNLSFRNELPSKLNDTEIKNVRASFLSQYGSFLSDVDGKSKIYNVSLTKVKSLDGSQEGWIWSNAVK